MKKLTVITFLLFLGLVYTPEIFAQDADLTSFMDEHLTDEEKDQVKRAKENISKGDKLDSQIKEEDSKVQKYFSKKQKKGEKKSVEVKTLRIKQALYYEKGYALIYNVYSQKVGECVFVYEEDEAKVKELLDDASADNSGAKRKMKDYKEVSPKDLKKIEYTKLKSDLQGAINLYTSSIKKLIEAYSIFLDQETKKQLEEEESRVWQNALSDNTIYSFQNYLNDFPNGKYASEARSQISDLEEQEKRKAEDERARSMSGSLVFQVQIAASKASLPKWKIAKFYKATDEVTMKNYDGWFKYSVGSFKKYEEAKNFVKATRVRGAFVVAYLNGEKIDIKQAIQNQ